MPAINTLGLSLAALLLAPALAAPQTAPSAKLQMVTVEPGVQLEVLDWGGSGRPLIFLAGSGVLAAMLLMHSLWPSLLGAAVVLAGLPVRWLLLRGKQITPTLAGETQLS